MTMKELRDKLFFVFEGSRRAANAVWWEEDELRNDQYPRKRNKE